MKTATLIGKSSLFVAPWFVLVACGGGGNAPATSADGARAAGHRAAARLLEGALVAPSTAVYPWETVTVSAGRQIEGAPSWIVAGAVDSQNALGATVRGQWEVVIIERAAGQLAPLHCSLDGATVWGSVEYAAVARGAGLAPGAGPEPAAREVEPAPARDPDTAAARKLALARGLIDNGQAEAGAAWLREVIEDYPGTAAAVEAREILDDQP